MTQAQLGHYNVLFTNKSTVIHGDVLEVTKRCSVSDLNEGSAGRPEKGIKAALTEAGWDFQWDAPSDWLIWDPKVWTPGKVHGVEKICKSAKEYGVDVKFNPERYLSWRILHHTASKTRHLFFYTHLPAGYAAPAGAFPSKVERVKDLMAKEALHNLDLITGQLIRRYKTVKFHHLLGDLNSTQRNDREPWYPANVLDDNWVPDTEPQSIDWMLHSKVAKQNKLVVVKRNNIRGPEFHSDHPFGQKIVRW